MTGRKWIVVFSVLVFSVFAFIGRANAVEMSEWDKMSDLFGSLGLSQEDLDDIKDLVDNRSEPFVNDVYISPTDPRDGEPVRIYAGVVTPDSPYGDDIYEVYVNYSVDGGATFTRIEMERSRDGDDLWEAVIPGQPSGTEVLYGIQAVNAYDEVYVEAVCPIWDDSLHRRTAEFEDCDGERNQRRCNAGYPDKCMFPMSFSKRNSDSPSRDNYDIIPDDLFVEGTKVGFDDNDLYMEISVKSKISPGTLSPMDANIYVAGWINPDKGKGADTGIDAVLKQGAAVIYAPLNASTACTYYFFRGITLESDYQSAYCEPQKDRLVVAVSHEAVGANPSGILEFVFITFNMVQYTPPDVDLMDLTFATRVNFVERFYVVE